MKNIVLVGFMGTGKTVTAKKLAERLGMKYISTDKLIEEKEKRSILDIFGDNGEKHFRKVEKDVVKEVSIMENIVVDAGGGVVINPENVKNLKNKGVMICLWTDPKVIFERTKKHVHRPLLNVDNPLQKIEELLSTRKPFYERADHHINTTKMSIEEVVSEIEGIVKNA